MLAADLTFDVIQNDTAPPQASARDDVVSAIIGPFEQRIDIASDAGEALGQTSSFETVIHNGPSSNRVDLVILGDGYTATEIDTVYVTHSNAMLNYLFNAGQEPFPRYAKYFNSHRIDVVSNESGADKPPEGVFVDTALDSYYFCNNIERLICINNSKANAAKNTALAGAGFSSEMDFVTVNDTKYGGSGGQYAVFAGGNGSATEVALHEVAHSFSNLADEYGGSPSYSGNEPSEINVTTDPRGAKWQQWIGYNQPVIGNIDVYEGGRYFNAGLYRPSSNSKMRSLGRPFDAVSREKIILDIYDLVDPIDSWFDNSSSVQDSDPTLWVDVIDSDVVNVQWSVDGFDVLGAIDPSFQLRDFGFGDGVHSVSVRAYDPTDWVRRDRAKLEQTIQWTVEVEPLLTPGVLSVDVNEGDASRSNVTSVTVLFDSLVDHASLQSAFVIENVTTSTEVGTVDVNSSDISGQSVSTLTFAGASTITPQLAPSLPNTLADGNYRLEVIAGQVRLASDIGVTMASNFQFGGQTSAESDNDDFFRWYGDVDGNGFTDFSDFANGFLPAFGSGLGSSSTNYRADLDFDGDGYVDFLDFANGFLPRFGTARP